MNLISYTRVSTDKQGRSGLGLEAQQAAVAQYAQSQGATILASYQEVESGKNCQRPELAKALSHARLSGAVLVIAKLDRLSRNVAFISALMEACKLDGLQFVCCDTPNATPFTIHIYAAMAEEEARRNSQRTKDALAAAKARGKLLGASNPKCRKGLTRAARKLGAQRAGQQTHERAERAYGPLRGLVSEVRSGGGSVDDVAAKLNAAGYCTLAGVPWQFKSAQRLCQRFGV